VAHVLDWQKILLAALREMGKFSYLSSTSVIVTVISEPHSPKKAEAIYYFLLPTKSCCSQSGFVVFSL